MLSPRPIGNPSGRVRMLRDTRPMDPCPFPIIHYSVAGSHHTPVPLSHPSTPENPRFSRPRYRGHSKMGVGSGTAPRTYQWTHDYTIERHSPGPSTRCIRNFWCPNRRCYILVHGGQTSASPLRLCYNRELHPISYPSLGAANRQS